MHSIPAGEKGAAAISAIVAGHARQRPQLPAIVDRDGTHNFAQLEYAIARRANEVQMSEVPRNGIVAITAEREFATLVNLLGVIRAQRVPLLLDRLHPRSYSADRLEQVRAAAVVTGDLPVQLNGDPRTWTILGDDDAYVSFTSGTSGRPQGVITPWAAVENYLAWAPEAFGDTQLHRFALISGLGHDPLWRDLLTPLLLGATLFVPSPRQWASATALAAFVVNNNIQAFSCTPTQMSAIAKETEGRTAPSLRRVLLGGEPLMSKTVDAARRWAPAARLFNVYGLTETPQVAAVMEIGESQLARSRPLPIGSPAPGFHFAISEHETLVVTSGPMARAVIDADGRLDPMNLPFDTGDLAYRQGDNYVVSGRLDRVTNIGGARVDLTMVESTITAIDGVASCRVSADEDVLSALVFADFPESGVTRDFIRRSLSKTVPLSHIPSQINVAPSKAQITLNGKFS